jgi:hypothetical protein
VVCRRYRRRSHQSGVQDFGQPGAGAHQTLLLQHALLAHIKGPACKGDAPPVAVQVLEVEVDEGSPRSLNALRSPQLRSDGQWAGCGNHLPRAGNLCGVGRSPEAGGDRVPIGVEIVGVVLPEL